MKLFYLHNNFVIQEEVYNLFIIIITYLFLYFMTLFSMNPSFFTLLCAEE